MTQDSRDEKSAPDSGNSIVKSVQVFYQNLTPRMRAYYGSGIAAVLLVVIILIIVLANIGGGESGSDGPEATAIPNQVEGLRLSSDTDTGRSDQDGITSAIQPKLIIDARDSTTVEILFNGEVIDTLDSKNEIEFEFAEELPDGVFGVEARLLGDDGAELLVRGPLFVTIDTIAPSPPSAVRLSPDTDLGLSINDGLTSIEAPAISGNSGVGDTVRVMIGADTAGESISDVTGEWSVVLRKLDEGQHTITAIAEDAAGNVGIESSPYTFTLDLTPPVLSVDSPDDESTLRGTETLTGSFSDEGSGIAGVDYRIGEGSYFPVSTNTQSGIFSGALIVDDDLNGDQVLTVTAFDVAGNMTEVNRDVSVEIERPFAVAETRPVNGARSVGVTVKPEVYFSVPVDVETLNSQSVKISSGGRDLPASIVPAGDGKFVWIFPDEPVPGDSSVTVTLDGDQIRSAGDDALLDGDSDGRPGGDLIFSYSTVSVQPVAGTRITGIIADPGPDNQPMTDDDLDPGPDGEIGTGDDIPLLPIPGVEISLLGLPSVMAVSDANGSYSINSVPAGSVKVKIDGLTGTAPSDFYFPEMVMDVRAVAGEDNFIMPGHRIAYLPRLPDEILQTVDASDRTMIVGDSVSAPQLPSDQQELLSIEIQPDSLIAPDGTSLDSAEIGISTVPPELVVDMLPPGVLQHTFDITVQAPGVANFAVPAPMTFPNVFDATPGTQLNFLSFNHDTGLLEIEGTATVSENGESVSTDPGAGIVRTGWHGLTRPGSVVLPGCNPEEEPQVDVDPNPAIGRVSSIVGGSVLLDLSRGDRTVTGPLDDELWTIEELIKGRNKQSAYRIRVENRDENGKAAQRTDRSECERVRQTPLMVEVIIRGPAADFLTVSLDSHGKNRTLLNPASKSVLFGEAPNSQPDAEAIFGFMLEPGQLEDIVFTPKVLVRRSNFNPSNADATVETVISDEILFGTSVEIRAFKWRTPEDLLIREKINLYSWTDIGDANDRDGFASMPDATVDGRGSGASRRPVELRMPEAVTFVSDDPAFSFIEDTVLGFTGFQFDPIRVKDDQLGGIDVISPDGQKTGTIPVEGDGIIAEVWVNEQQFLDTLENVFRNGGSSPDQRPNAFWRLIDTPERRQAIFDSVISETIDRLFIHITPGPDGRQGTNDDGGIRFVSTQERGTTLDIRSWTGPAGPTDSERRSGGRTTQLGQATGIDWEPFSPLDLVKADKPFMFGGATYQPNRQSFAFKLTESLNEESSGNIDIYLDRWIRIIDRTRFDSPTVAFIEGVASTIAHEIGHSIGIVHTSTNFDPKDQTQLDQRIQIDDADANGDLMAQGADFRGELTLPVTGEAYGIALGQFWEQKDVLRARNYFAKYWLAMVKVARERGLPRPQRFNVEGGGSDNSEPIIDFVGEGTSFLVSNPGTEAEPVGLVDFGTVPADTAEAREQTFGLFNIGDRDLTIDMVIVDPRSSSAFSVNRIRGGTVIAPSESVDVVVTFDPESGGRHEGGLIIVTDEEVGGGVYGLTGIGERQEPDISLEVVNNNLGGVVAETGTSGSQVVGTITNIGSQLLTIDSAEIGDDGSPFTVSSINGPVNLQPGQSLDITAAFAPVETGLQRATVVIESNDPDTPQVGLGLAGTGTAEFPGTLVDWGNDFTAVETPDSDVSPTLRAITDDEGNWEFFLPPETTATFITFDPVSGLVSSGGTVTAEAGTDTAMPIVPFTASVTPDFDGDGLPADIEFAIGTSDSNQDSDGDGIDDFTAVLAGDDPLGDISLPTGIVSQLNLDGNAEAVAIGSSPSNTDAVIAYVATGDAGFASVDITNPLQPRTLSELSLPGENLDLAIDLGTSRVFVAAGSAGIHVIDISNPAVPRVVQNISTPGQPTRLTLSEFGLFAASGRELLAIDIGLAEVIVNIPATGSVLEAIGSEGDHVFLTDQSGNFVAVDVSTALSDGQMSVTSSVATHRVERLTVLEEVAYLAAEGSYTTFDVSDPSNVELISDTANGEPNEFGVELVPGGDGVGALIYALFDREPTVQLMDISNPARTGEFITRFDLPENPQDAAFAAGLVVIADGVSGLMVINFQPADANGVAPTGIMSIVTEDQDPNTPGTQLREGSVAVFSVDASDDVQVKSVELLRDGVVAQSDASFPFELFVTLPALSQGDSVEYQARVTDTGGNSSATNTVEVELLPDDRGARLISIDPNDRGFAATGEVQVEALFSKALAAETVTAENVRLTGSSGSPVTPSDISVLDAGRRVRLTYPSLTAGQYTLTVDGSRVTDTSGVPAGGAITSSFEVIDADNRWISPANGDWSDPENWSAGRVPNSTDVVVISVPGSITVTFSGVQIDGEAGQLYVDERLEVARRGLVIQDDVGVSGTLVFGGNTTLISDGVFDLRGTLNGGLNTRFRAATFLNTGSILSPESGIAFVAGDFDNRGFIRSRGFTLGQNPGFRLGGEGPITFTNHEDGLIEIIGDGQFNAFTVDSQIVNLGVIRSDGGDGLFGNFTNNGLLEVVSGAYRIGAREGSVSEDATYLVSEGAILNLESVLMEFRGTTTFEGEGLVNVDNGMDAAQGAVVNLNMTGEGFRLNSNVSLTGDGSFVNNEKFIWRIGTIKPNTPFENRGELEILGVPTVPVQLDGDLINFGTILHTENKTLEIENATLTNASSGIYNFASDGDIDSRNNNNTHFFVNEGTLIKTSGSDVSDLDVVWTNTGPVEVQTGIIRTRRQANLTDTVIDVSADTQFRISFGNHTINGTFSAVGDGLILVGASPTFVTVADDTEVVFENTGGLRFLDGTWNGGGSIRLASDTIWSGGTFGTNGGVVNEAGQTVTVSGDSAKTVMSGIFQNDGVMSLEGSGRLQIENGSVVNGPSSTINFLSTGGFDLRGSAPATLVNQGVINKTAGGAALVDVDFNNTGSVNLEAGRLDFFRVFVQTAGAINLTGGNISVGTNGTLALNGGVLAGSGTITGSVVNRAAIHVGGEGQIGTIVVTQRYRQESNGTLLIEIGDSGTHDVLDIRATGGGAVTLDGALSVSAIDGFSPNGSDVFEVLIYRNVTGDFASFAGLNIDGTALAPSANSNGYTLTAP